MLIHSDEYTFIVMVVVVDVNNLKNGKEASEVTKESPEGCAGEGEQSKGN